MMPALRELQEVDKQLEAAMARYSSFDSVNLRPGTLSVIKFIAEEGTQAVRRDPDISATITGEAGQR